MKQVLNFVSGLLLGAMFGAAIAVLLAPASGEELRTQLRQRAQALQEELSRAAAERRAELEKQLAHLRSSAP